MHTLRSLSRLRRWVVAWFFLGLGVAMASPLVQPHTLELICSGGGSASLVVHDSGGKAAPDTLGMDCALCLVGAAPPQSSPRKPPALQASTHSPAAPPRVRAVEPSAAPPPARAPPFPVCTT